MNAEIPTEEQIPGGNDMAFPVEDPYLCPNNTVQVGLTKRELFAAMAMAQLAPAYMQPGNRTFSDIAAKQAVDYADALLKELAK